MKSKSISTALVFSLVALKYACCVDVNGDVAPFKYWAEAVLPAADFDDDGANEDGSCVYEKEHDDLFSCDAADHDVPNCGVKSPSIAISLVSF